MSLRMSALLVALLAVVGGAAALGLGGVGSSRKAVARLSAPRMAAALAELEEPDAVVASLCAAGMPRPQAEEIWEKRPNGRLPKAAQQAVLIEWLQAKPLAGAAQSDPLLLYKTLRRAPKLMLRAGQSLCRRGSRLSTHRRKCPRATRSERPR